MMRSIMIPVFIAIALSMSGLVDCCSVPVGWKIKSVAERAKSAEIVFYGKVIKSPTKWNIKSSEAYPVLNKEKGLYPARVEMYCVFKGDIMQTHLNISGYGYLSGHCLEDHVVEGDKGIFFVRMDRSGNLVAQNVNVQKSMSVVDRRTLWEVIKATEESARKPSSLHSNRSGRRPERGCPIMALLQS